MNPPDKLLEVNAKLALTREPFPASRKTYLGGSRPDVRVPVREVSLSNGEQITLYDTSRPYTDPDAVHVPHSRFVGASEIESEDRSPVSMRSAVELMTAAHSAMPTLGEARIERLDRNLRPALPDNNPCIESTPGRVRINGLFRHGWLLAPALVERALRDALPTALEAA